MSIAVVPAPVAIIGIGCLFPDAPDQRQFWANLRAGVDSIRDVPPSHWRVSDYLALDPKAPDRIYAAKGGFLPPIKFAPLDHGIAPNTLEAIDTTQLLGLVVAQAALADAGLLQRGFEREKASVILGITGTLPLVIPLGARLGHPLWREALHKAGIPTEQAEEVVRRIADGYVGWQEDSFPGLLGNVVAGRIANRLNLGGTNCVVDAACASSLSAVNLAILELAAGKSDLVITGGFDTFNDIFMYMCFSKTPALSPTGQSRPFAADGDGTTLGEGLGCLILKRLKDAEKDGDRIYAVIKALAASSDGKGQAIYAPCSKGQARAIQAACAEARVSPTEIDLVEAHGTGTRAGDLAELQGLLQVYGSESRRHPCALGSVKSQIGHTKAAAGAAGLVKAALALHHKVIPPTLKVDQPLPELAQPKGHFFLPTIARPWVSAGRKRRAAVSSFGFGGSNFHAILEEYGSAKSEVDWDGRVEILALSATSAAALRSKLEAVPISLEWSAFREIARTSRQSFVCDHQYRLVLVLEEGHASISDLVQRAKKRLDANTATPWDLSEGVYFGQGRNPGPMALLFPGQGSQRVGMLPELFLQFPEALEALESAGTPPEARDLAEVIFPPTAWNADTAHAQEAHLKATDQAQPAIGVASWAAFRVLTRFGIRFAATAGHSFGELPALAAAGWLPAADLHTLSRRRGQLMAKAAKQAEGGMMAVHGSVAALNKWAQNLPKGVSIANRNSPEQWVVAGEIPALQDALLEAESLGLRCQRLAVAGAFHSASMRSCQRPFIESLGSVRWTPTDIPVVSNAHGRPFPRQASEVCNLLARQLCEPVDFVSTLDGLWSVGCRTFVEVGPGTVLSRLAAATLAQRPAQCFSLDASQGRRSSIFDLARLLGRLMALGYPVHVSDWQESFSPASGRAEKPKFTVQLCGANYVGPKTTQADLEPHNRSVHKEPPQRASKSVASAHKPTRPAESSSLSQIEHSTMVPSMSPPPNADVLTALLRMTEMQTEVQTRFLALQEKMLHALHLAPASVPQLAAPMHHARPSENGHRPMPSGNGQDLHAADRHRQPERVKLEGEHRPAEDLQARLREAQIFTPTSNNGASELPHSPNRPAQREHTVRNGSPKTATSKHADLLKRIVAQKTGYPLEMLELDQELDADLGIDSIKRVEIFAAVQEALPGTAALRPEDANRLRTLRQIVAWLEGDVKPEPKKTKADSPGMEIGQILREVVATKTGYPLEMLEMHQQLDADLGIDSIKRVEIFAALQEQLPAAPELKPEHVGKLRTLAEVAAFLGGVPVASNGITQPPASAGEVSREAFFYSGSSPG